MKPLEICNMSLQLVRRNPVRSFEEMSEEALALKLHYPLALEKLLRLQKWDFARKASHLVKIRSAAANDLRGHVYAYPSDCVYIRNIWSDRGVACDYEIFYLEDGQKVICADVEIKRIDYTCRLTETMALPADFAQMLAYYLAFSLSLAFSADGDLSGQLFRIYERLYMESAKAMYNEAPKAFTAGSEILAARDEV